MHRNSFFNRLDEAISGALFHQVSDFLYDRGRRPVFVEVGANDGISSSKTIEFIRHHEWRGVEVEPVPTVFKELQRNLAPYDRVKTVNKAIADRSGDLTFYQVIGKGEKEGDVHLPMISSFDRDTILKQRTIWPNIEEFIEEIRVPTVTIADLCKENGIDELDILITDAEGYDDIIVKTLDLGHYRPVMINIEHIHIPAERLRELDAKLMAYGYQRCIMWMDTAWFQGDILADECIQRMIRSLPTFMPDRDPIYGNGYWINQY